jgi:hypothetical protein
MKARRDFEAQHDECIAIVRRIKIRNDTLNKRHGLEQTSRELIMEVEQDKQFVVS